MRVDSIREDPQYRVRTSSVSTDKIKDKLKEKW